MRSMGTIDGYWADAQADLSLRCAHTHFVDFVMSRLIYCYNHSELSTVSFTIKLVGQQTEKEW